MRTIEERVAVLETKLDTLEARVAELEPVVESVADRDATVSAIAAADAARRAQADARRSVWLTRLLAGAAILAQFIPHTGQVW